MSKALVSLNMHIYKSKRLMFKGSTTYNNEGFTLFASIFIFFMIAICKKKEKSALGYIQNYGYILSRAFVNSKSKNTLIRLIDEHVNCNRTLNFHLHDGCFKKNLAHMLVSPNQWIENVN
jgi:hypothetical protein